jgi:periplasmic divalent cation tolerance protein
MAETAYADAIIVITNLPDRDAALELAETLMEKRLAACVNVLAACTSVYRWKQAIETAQEVPLLIKTRDALYPEVEAAIRRAHPYELPEIVAVPLVRGLPGYLEWIAAETTISIV